MGGGEEVGEGGAADNNRKPSHKKGHFKSMNSGLREIFCNDASYKNVSFSAQNAILLSWFHMALYDSQMTYGNRLCQ